MINVIKKYFKDWILFEKLILILSLVTISVVGIIFKSSFFTLFTALTAVTTTMLLAKGKKEAYIFYLICIILYIFVSYDNRYYGEVILYLFLILPMCISSLITWVKHPYKKTNTVEVNMVLKKEMYLVYISILPISILLYFILKTFNTNELLVSTFTFVCSLLANYFQIRRNKNSFYFYVIEDVSLLVLWIIPIIKGDLSLLPLIINSTFNLISDSYGVYNWRKLEKTQGGKNDKNC